MLLLFGGALRVVFLRCLQISETVSNLLAVSTQNVWKSRRCVYHNEFEKQLKKYTILNYLKSFTVISKDALLYIIKMFRKNLKKKLPT